MSKTIILYYSFEGNTKNVADFIAKELNLPIERIRPINDLKSKGFSKYPIGGGQVVMGRKPDLMPIRANLDDYDTVIIGTPVWAGSFTPAIKTLLETGKLKDKNIAFFYCHDGGPGKVENKMKRSIAIYNKPISAYELVRVKDGLELLKQGVLNWAKSLV